MTKLSEKDIEFLLNDQGIEISKEVYIGMIDSYEPITYIATIEDSSILLDYLGEKDNIYSLQEDSKDETEFIDLAIEYIASSLDNQSVDETIPGLS